MKFKKSYLILGSLLSASVIPMVAMSCATTKTDDKKPMEVKEDKEKNKPGTSTATPTTPTPSADKQGADKANTPASTTPTDTSNQAGKAEGDSAGKTGTDAEATPGSANGTGTNQPATPPSTGQGDTAMSS